MYNALLNLGPLIVEEIVLLAELMKPDNGWETV